MSKTLQGKYADKLNKQIEELYKVIDNKDKIINEQVLKIEDLQQRINKAIEYIKNKQEDINNGGNDMSYRQLTTLLEILGDKE